MEEKIRKYANFLLSGCLKLGKGDRLFIIGITFIQDFVDIISEEAKNIGIEDIEYLISDPDLQKRLYMTSSYEELIGSDAFSKKKFNQMAKDGYAFLNISSPIPDYFAGIDEELMGRVTQYQMKSIGEYREYQNKGIIKWNISAVPNEYWAKSLGLSVKELWEYILEICLINEESPLLAWQEKSAKLKARAEYLNSLKIDRLVYKNSLGTNLEIGLPVDYVFGSADGGVMVNMPTEEVFTSPHFRGVNGKVYSSKMLLHNNNVINDFWLEFRDGEIINYDAKEGLETLRSIIKTDLGSRFLGEVALVDYDSPISRTNIIFKNTLYDENASCHLAIGASFAECIKGGLKLGQEELLERGLNQSSEHVDFFIGTADLEVKAILKTGEEVVIMEDGNFVRSEE